MKRIKGNIYDFMPNSFIVPRRTNDLKRDILLNPERVYIQKPLASSRGRGIRLIVNPDKILKLDKEFMVQQYIKDPFTINGYKIDLRIYVLVTSYDPLIVYIYQNGLVRFATEIYKFTKVIY